MEARPAIVRRSKQDCGEATGDVSSMYSTPNSSSSFAMAIFSSVVKCAFENCSPSRSVESMIANRSIGTPFLPQWAKKEAGRATCAPASDVRSKL